MTWSQWFELTPNEVANEAPTSCGVFVIAHKTEVVAYPTAPATTLFIGMAPDRQRGLRAVLGELMANDGNALATERRTQGGLRFCFQANLGDRARTLHDEIVADFVRQHGAPPRCNGPD